ncbi:MAG TPA: hypothetical protein GX003_04480 [Acholeplasmataceae bacterium]|nr:hypothetical protein [Acholeplasmataceae bacterium]
MVLGNLELQKVIKSVCEFMESQLINKNRTGQLQSYLQKIEYEDFNISKEKAYFTNKQRSKIIVIGDSNIKENIIIGIFKEAGISKERLELVLDYNSAKNYKFSKLEYNTNYGAIIFGPIPHSTKEKGYYSSVIYKIKEEYWAYPEVIQLGSQGSLKITKTNLSNAVNELITRNIIQGNI